EFEVGTQIWIEVFPKANLKGKPGIIINRQGAVVYVVKDTTTGQRHVRHLNCLREGFGSELPDAEKKEVEFQGPVKEAVYEVEETPELWSMITTIAAYMDIRGYNRYYEIESAPKPKPVPVPTTDPISHLPTDKRKSDDDHISEMWRTLDTRPLPKRYRRPKGREEGFESEPPVPAYKTRYTPADTTSDDSARGHSKRPSRKPRLDSVKER
uniref:Uncharacterized protein n=1 Tax=Strigamia maritima TaxID=126957 RepID=T1ILN4_STRMM